MDNDLISRKALLKKATYLFDEALGYELCVLAGDIQAAPAVDAVPIIRCKDCKLWMYINDDVGLCVVDVPDIEGVVREAHSFCNYGERKTDES